MRIVELVLTPEEAFDEEKFNILLYKKLGLKQDGSVFARPVKRSIDARSRNVIVRVQCEIVAPSEKKPLLTYSKEDLRDVSSRPTVIVVGSGPAGLFSALRLIELGYKP